MYKKIVCNMFTGAACVVLAWAVLSWVEIICKNLNAGATYSDYNLIVNLINYYIGGSF